MRITFYIYTHIENIERVFVCFEYLFVSGVVGESFDVIVNEAAAYSAFTLVF